MPSLISPTVDFTGHMSQSELNKQDIQNLTDEITRLQQNQDAINQSLNIMAQGKQAVNVSAGGSGSIQIPFATNTANTFLVYVQPSDRVGQYYTVPYYEFNTSSAVTLRFSAYSTAAQGGNQPGMYINYLYPTNATLTFYYFIIQQPANATL